MKTMVKLMTRSIFSDRTPLMVGDVADDSVLVQTPRGEVLRVPRFWVETPVLCCVKCDKPMIVIKHQRQEIVQCPDHARHMYELTYTASHDVKRYNRKQRRDFTQQSRYWLGKWRKQHNQRTEVPV
jgi:hypothetical protein